MSKKKTRASNAAVLALLIGAFPKTFTVDSKKPLKVGIASDLIGRLDGAIRPRELGLALTLYCNSAAYLRSCKTGAERIDLDGNAAGVVTAAQAEHAIDKLAEFKAKAKKVGLAATKPQPPPAEASPKKLSLVDLKIAAQMRKEAAAS
jgi:ProP effector